MFLEVLIIGVLAAFLSIFLNYCMGKPASEKFSPYEIFSFYTVWLSIRRLKQVGLWAQYEDQYYDNEERIKSRSQLITLKNDFKKIYYDAAEPFFYLGTRLRNVSDLLRGVGGGHCFYGVGLIYYVGFRYYTNIYYSQWN